MTIHAKLFELLSTFSIQYPVTVDGKQQVIPVPSHPTRRIKGRAFFPGGSGHSEGELAPLPANPILALGDNFGCQQYYDDCVTNGEEPLDNSTWKNLLEIYEQVELDSKCCFHSNVYMGFIPGNSNSKKKMVVKNDFRCDCEKFLTCQIRTITPKGIIALGNKAKDALANISPEVQTFWGSKSYDDLYLSNSLLLRNVSIPIDQGTWCGDMITITHPAYRKVNLSKSRRRLGFDTESVELESLREFVSRNTQSCTA